MILNDLTTYYAALLAYQYRNQPNAVRTIEIFAKQMLADYFVQQLTTCFDIDLAVGPQLDILGKYVGAPRNLGIVVSKPLFGFFGYDSTLDPTLYQGRWDPSTDTPTIPAADPSNAGWWYAVNGSGVSSTPISASFEAGNTVVSDGTTWIKSTTDNANGFTAYGNPGINPEAVFSRYAFSSGQNSDLTDAEYRTVIKLKIILNSNDGTLASIMDYLVRFFPNEIFVVDSTLMRLDYSVVSTVSLSKELLMLYLPRPMGVEITVTIISPVPTGNVPITTEDDVLITTEDNQNVTT